MKDRWEDHDRSSNNQSKLGRLIFSEGVIYAGIAGTEIGVVLLSRLDKGPLNPAASCSVLIVGIVILRVGTELRDRILDIKRDKYGDEIS